MSIKLCKYFFIVLIICLIMAGIYITYLEDKDKEEGSAVSVKKTSISREIVIGITDFDTINPILTKNLEISGLTKLVFLPLIEITQDFKAKPVLAEECSKLDELTYIVKLDNNKKWADGDTITFEDVDFTVNIIKTSDTIYKENVREISKLEKIDENTFKIYLEEPVDFFEYNLSFPIMKEKTYNEEIPTGSGNFKISNVDKKSVIIEGNDIKIIVKLYNNATELYNNFTKGNIDLIITQNTNYNKYIGNIGFKETIITGRDFYYLSCENIDSIEARKLIKNQIKKEQIVYKLFNNKYVLAEFPLEYGSYLNKNMEDSNQFESSIKKMRVSLSVSSENVEIAELIKKQLQERGIYTNIQKYLNKNADLILKKKTVSIKPDIKEYFMKKEQIQELDKISKIEDEQVLIQEYEKIIDKYYAEQPIIGLFFNSYIVLHSDKLYGDFSGNWYNLFYNIDTWYKVK